jgi:tetratricopeptide (TPR) repeat protein
MSRLAFLLPAALFLLAAGPQSDASPEHLIRRANAAFLAGDRDAADQLYAAAEERTADPGLVAFNRAAVLFQQGEFRDAELHYTRVLDDAACPPDRAARAWYNRGTCLLRRGASSSVYRSAIACLERCADSDDADEPLKADARYNLEIAKTLWNEARKAEGKKDTPNEKPPPEDPRNDGQPPPGWEGTETQPGSPEMVDGNNGPRPMGSLPQPDPNANPTTRPNPNATPTHGDTTAPQLKDEAAVQPLSPEDTREHLRRAAERLRKDRRDLLRAIYPPEQPGVRDW